MQQRFEGAASFSLVYIAEAHARDEWPVGDPIAIDQALTLADRTAHAAALRDTFRPLLDDWTMLVDDPQPANGSDRCSSSCDGDSKGSTGGDAFDRAYAAWPTRFYVLSAPEDAPVRLVFKAEPDRDNEYKLQTLQDFLSRSQDATQTLSE